MKLKSGQRYKNKHTNDIVVITKGPDIMGDVVYERKNAQLRLPKMGSAKWFRNNFIPLSKFDEQKEKLKL